MSRRARAPSRFIYYLYLCAAVAALSAAPRAASAEADPVDLLSQARQAMIRLDFDRAIRLLERAESAGRSRREHLVLLYRSLAESRASLGNADAAETEFRRLLALDPAAELPPGSSPKITAPFDAARDFMKQRPPLGVTCQRGPEGAVLAVQSDPLGLIAGARLLEDGTALARARRKSGRTRIALTVPVGAPGELDCAAVDRHGNELARAQLGSPSDQSDAPERVPGVDPTTILSPTNEPPPRPRRSSALAMQPEPDTDDTGAEPAPTTSIERTPERPAPPIYARWWLWGSGALVAAGASAFFAVQLQAAEDEWRDIKRNSQDHTYEEALAVQDRGERHALYGNIATVTSAALAAVSVGFLVHELVNAGSQSEAEATVGAAPLPGGGAAATLRLSF